MTSCNFESLYPHRHEMLRWFHRHKSLEPVPTEALTSYMDYLLIDCWSVVDRLFICLQTTPDISTAKVYQIFSLTLVLIVGAVRLCIQSTTLGLQHHHRYIPFIQGPAKGGQFCSFVFCEIWNTASFVVITTIKTNRKFCDSKIFAKLNENISKTFQPENIHFKVVLSF